MDVAEGLDSSGLLINVPKRQRGLNLRLQQLAAAAQQKEAEESARAAAEQEEEEPAPEDDWYSSDDDDSTTITDVLKNIKSMVSFKKM